MHGDALSNVYKDYIDCLNARDIRDLSKFVHDNVHYNGELIGLAGYGNMLLKDFDDIPDLVFRIELLLIDAPYVASRLAFDCMPRADFLGLHVNGRRVSFKENVFYEFEGAKIVNVWSVIDKAAIEAQLEPGNGR